MGHEGGDPGIRGGAGSAALGAAGTALFSPLAGAVGLAASLPSLLGSRKQKKQQKKIKKEVAAELERQKQFGLQQFAAGEEDIIRNLNRLQEQQEADIIQAQGPSSSQRAASLKETEDEKARRLAAIQRERGRFVGGIEHQRRLGSLQQSALESQLLMQQIGSFLGGGLSALRF